MNLIEVYKNQYKWRSWDKVYDRLPDMNAQTVLDLGCAVGDQAADFTTRGARVIGIDLNADLLKEAELRCSKNARFIRADFRNLPNLNEQADGLWCSFAAAYVIDFDPVLKAWKKYIKKGGWIALTEIDNFFSHEPLSKNVKSMLENYALDSYQKGRYDFNMGRKLEGFLKNSGFKETETITLNDQEFSFSGPAPIEVTDAWQKRFDRMTLLHEFCGSDYDDVRSEFISCLEKENHRSLCKVICCIAKC
jgi:ubiquinone/menaquinone biosynthesis C-methylase UbiE